MRLVLLTTRPAYIVDCLENTRVDITIVLSGRLTTDIGRGRHDSLLETETEFLGEGLVGDADTQTAIVGNEVLCQIDGTVEDECRGLGILGTLQTVNQLPCHIGHVSEIALHAGIAVDQTDQCFRVVALFDLVDALHCLGIGCIATDAPHGVGRIENHPTLAHRLNSISYIVFLLHTFFFLGTDYTD